METKKKFGIAAVAAALVLSGGIVVNAQTITNPQLPATAQAFIKNNFSGQTIAKMKTEKELTGTEYDVLLSNGVEIEFDSNGNWEDIDGNNNTLPLTVVPKPIADYLAQNYKGQAVHQIEKKRTGYEVETTNGTDLDFDAAGKFVRIDD